MIYNRKIMPSSVGVVGMDFLVVFSFIYMEVVSCLAHDISSLFLYNSGLSLYNSSLDLYSSSLALYSSSLDLYNSSLDLYNSRLGLYN